MALTQVAGGLLASGAVDSTQMASGAALANIGAGNITPTYLASKAEIGPVFWGYRTSDQAGTAGRSKYNMNTAVIDTHSGFSAANSRWTVPTGESGNYIITSSMYIRLKSGSSTNQALSWIYVNGSELTYAELDLDSATALFYGHVISHMRATALSAGDYVEQWFQCPTNFSADTRATGLRIERIR
jgi:hypothetical protein